MIRLRKTIDAIQDQPSDLLGAEQRANIERYVVDVVLPTALELVGLYDPITLTAAGEDHGRPWVGMAPSYAAGRAARVLGDAVDGNGHPWPLTELRVAIERLVPCYRASWLATGLGEIVRVAHTIRPAPRAMAQATRRVRDIAETVMLILDQPPADVYPVGATEIAALAGVQRTSVERWTERRGEMPLPFPPPAWTVGNRPAWRRSDVHRWLRDTGRWPEDAA